MSSVLSSVGGAIGKFGGAIGGALGGIGSAIGSSARGAGGLGNIITAGAGILDAYGNYKSSKSVAKATQQAVNVADPFGPYRGNYASALSSLYNNPWQIANTPGYQFRLAQGLEGINRNAAAKGYLGSGNRLMELMRYGQDYGSQEFDKEVARLSGLSGATTGSPAQAGILRAQAGQSLGDIYGNTAGAIGQAARSIGGLFGNTSTYSADRTPMPMSVNLPGGGKMSYYQ